MNNKLQAKDLINLGLFTVLYFVLGCCVAIPIGFVPIFLPILGALWTLITGISIYVIPDKGKEVWYGNADGNSEWPFDGTYRNGILGCTFGAYLWAAGRFDSEIWQL